MGPNPNAFCCEFQSGLAQVTVQVATSTPLSRHHPDVATSISRRDINLSLCSLQLMSSDVATSILCRDITLCLCRFQLVAPDVATSISCRDISSRRLQPSLVVRDVATSISCRDINLCRWSLHWLFLVSRLQSSVATTALVTSASSFQSVVASRRVSCHDINPCRDINFCDDITMPSRHNSFSFCSSLSCLSCDPCRDLHEIPSIFLMS